MVLEYIKQSKLSSFEKLGILSIINTLISKGSFFLINLMLLKILGFESFGSYNLLKNTIDTFTGFVLLGIGTAISGQVAQIKNSSREIFSIYLSGILYIALTSIVVMVIAKFNSFSILNWLTENSLLECIFIIICSFSLINNSVLYGLQKYKLLTINAVISTIPTIILMYFGAIKFGYTGALNAYIGFYLILFLISSYQIYYLLISIDGLNNLKFNSNTIRNILDNFRKLFLISIPLGMASLLVGPVVLKGNYILCDQNNGRFEYGVFEAINQWRNIAILIPAAISQISYPLFAQQIEMPNSEKLVTLKSIGLKVLKINIFVIILIIIFTPILYNSFLKNEFSTIVQNKISFLLLMISTILTTLTNITGHYINGNNKFWSGLILNFMWAVVFVLLCHIFLDNFKMGSRGMSLVYLISYSFLLLCNILFIKKKLGE